MRCYAFKARPVRQVINVLSHFRCRSSIPALKFPPRIHRLPTWAERTCGFRPVFAVLRLVEAKTLQPYLPLQQIRLHRKIRDGENRRNSIRRKRPCCFYRNHLKQRRVEPNWQEKSTPLSRQTPSFLFLISCQLAYLLSPKHSNHVVPAPLKLRAIRMTSGELRSEWANARKNQRFENVLKRDQVNVGCSGVNKRNR